MPNILLVADEPWVHNAVRSALVSPDVAIIPESDPARAAPRIAADAIDAAVVDMQVGSMGGMAVTRAIRASASLGDSEDIPVILLLDRRADAFLAKRAGAAAWVLKPFDAHELRSAIAEALKERGDAA